MSQDGAEHIPDPSPIVSHDSFVCFQHDLGLQNQGKAKQWRVKEAPLPEYITGEKWWEMNGAIGRVRENRNLMVLKSNVCVCMCACVHA